YTTQVSIEGTHNFLKPGMSARVEVYVDYAPNALVVPVQVVANRSGKKVCFAVNSGKSVEKEVKTGLFNDTWVQILEGLNEGEEVMLNPPRINETKKESEKQLADKFPKNGQQSQPVLAQATDDPPQTSEPNRAGRRRQGMPMGMTGPQGMSGPPGMPPDFNQLDDATKEKIKQFREKVAKGEMPFDPNQMDEQSRERPRQLRNRTRPQSDGQTTSQEP
ncbi:MAG: hypothetical protein IMZ61_12075, partial [Planctomycetes bacterium]|nr:hypothetical protein [Planctomycetota bacterium]